MMSLMIFTQMHISLKIIQVILLSSVKFAFSPILAVGYGFNYWETVGLTSCGGIMGVFVFYYLSKAILKLYNYIKVKIRDSFRSRKVRSVGQGAIKKKVFSRRNKFIVKLRGKLGMYGIVVFTPLLLSIPVGCFLANKYYSYDKYIVLYLILSVIAWSMIISSVAAFRFI